MMSALIGFNVCVEVGQLAIVAIAFFTMVAWCSNHPDYRKWVAVPAFMIIGFTRAYWFVEQLFFA